MITEEALPTYQTLLNSFDGVSDPTGASDSAWSRWSRGWTAEENRHGDLLNRYLYLSGRVDMRSVEVTIQHLIRNGFDPGAHQDPYKGFVYTSFQERATRISHRNVARLAQHAGDEHLKTICGIIAGDEARHEKAYTAFISHIFDVDPSGAILAFRDLMKNQVVMPAHLMYATEKIPTSLTAFLWSPSALAYIQHTTTPRLLSTWCARGRSKPARTSRPKPPKRKSSSLSSARAMPAWPNATSGGSMNTRRCSLAGYTIAAPSDKDALRLLLCMGLPHKPLSAG